MKAKFSIMALAAVMLFTGCEAYVVEHRRPVRTYGYHGHRYYHGDYDDRRYSYRYSSYRRPSYSSYRRPVYSGYRRGYYQRPSTTVVVDTPVIRGSVRRWR